VEKLPSEIQLMLLEKKWILDTIDLHACIRSKSPRATAHLCQFPDLLFRIVSLPLSLEDARWVHDTFHLNANQTSRSRTLLSCVTHLVVRRNAAAVAALEKIHALGYRFSQADQEVLCKKMRKLTEHEIMHAVGWFFEQAERISNSTTGVASCG
jgi:hypothetical protein